MVRGLKSQVICFCNNWPGTMYLLMWMIDIKLIAPKKSHTLSMLHNILNAWLGSTVDCLVSRYLHWLPWPDVCIISKVLHFVTKKISGSLVFTPLPGLTKVKAFDTKLKMNFVDQWSLWHKHHHFIYCKARGDLLWNLFRTSDFGDRNLRCHTIY